MDQFLKTWLFMTVFRGDSSFVRKKRNLFMLYISDSRAQHLVRVASYFSQMIMLGNRKRTQ